MSGGLKQNKSNKVGRVEKKLRTTALNSLNT